MVESNQCALKRTCKVVTPSNGAEIEATSLPYVNWRQEKPGEIHPDQRPVS
jgi:hypothetical protein